MRKKVLVLAVAVVLIAGAALLVMKKRQEIAALPKPAAVRPVVQTAVAARGTLEATTHYLGVIEPYVRSDLSARISGNILKIYKREGDVVRAGEPVALIDDRELADRALAVEAEALATKQRLAGARSAYETQKTIYERDVELHREGAISKEALERSRAAFDGAQAAVAAYQESLQGMKRNAAAARTQAGYAKIHAPFAGVVSKRWSEPGDLAAPGKPILTVEKTSPCKVVVQLPQEEITGVKRGTKVYLTNGEQRQAAAVDRIHPALGRNLLGSVEIVLARRPFALPSGATVGVDLVGKRVAGVIVPENAVVKTDRGAFLYVVNKNVIRIKKVGILGVNAAQAAVSGPVQDGDTVVCGQENRLLSLQDGSEAIVAARGKQ